MKYEYEKMWGEADIKEIIRMAFPRGLDKLWYMTRKPQAFMLEKALKTLQIMLATQDINKMIDWAYKNDL